MKLLVIFTFVFVAFVAAGEFYYEDGSGDLSVSLFDLTPLLHLNGRNLVFRQPYFTEWTGQMGLKPILDLYY